MGSKVKTDVPLPFLSLGERKACDSHSSMQFLISSAALGCGRRLKDSTADFIGFCTWNGEVYHFILYLGHLYFGMVLLLIKMQCGLGSESYVKPPILHAMKDHNCSLSLESLVGRWAELLLAKSSCKRIVAIILNGSHCSE